MQNKLIQAMKSTQLLSVVLSLIMFSGITAGSIAFAASDGDVEDRLENFCQMTDEDKIQFFEDHPRLLQFEDRLANFCELDEEEREDAIEDFVNQHIPHARDYKNYDLKDKLERYCEMTDEEKRELIAKYDKTKEKVAKMNQYCELDEEGKDAFIAEHVDEYRMHHKDKDYSKDMRMHLERYCNMSESEKREYLSNNDKAQEHAEKINEYCTMDDSQKMAFIEEHGEEYKQHMKEKMMEHKDKKYHLDYDRLCGLSESDRALEIDDPERLDRISQWCDMTPEEREEYKKKHHDKKMSSDMSPRLKAMIMNKHDISDEKLEAIKMKYQEHYGDLTDEKRSELKMKFKEHMSSIYHGMTDEQRSAIHERLAEMKAFKAELREKASELTDEEKRKLRAEFLEKAKELHLAWISPRIQMNAGVDASDIECREGFTLVIKSSNGIPMCLKADTAITMIERGLAVPAS